MNSDGAATESEQHLDAGSRPSEPHLRYELGGSDYELYEDEEFVLTIDMPGFEVEDVEEDDITASYRNGVLEVTFPQLEGATTHGKTIPVEGRRLRRVVARLSAPTRDFRAPEPTWRTGT